MGNDPLVIREFAPKRCVVCEDTFTPNGSCHKYCSDECLEVAREEWYLRRVYKISKADYDNLLKHQEHRCKICGSEGFLMKEGHKKKLVVDHCHDSGILRGLLCHNCNRALGLFKESVHTMETAIKYLIDTKTAKI